MKKFVKKLLAFTISISTLTLSSCQTAGRQDNSNTENFIVGVVGDVEREVWEDVQKRLKDENVNLEIEVFSDYVQPNVALADDSIDMNAFQHMAFLAEFIVANNADLTAVGYTYISPMAAYSDSIKSLEELTEGSEILIPNDPTNGGRALLLLEQAGVIEVDDQANATPTTKDIIKNDKNIKITEIDAAQIFIGIKDVSAVIANTNFAVDAGFNPFKHGIFVDTEDLNKVASQYKNVMAVKTENADNAIIAKVVKAYQSSETAKKIKEVSDNADQKAWSENDNTKAELSEVLKQLEDTITK